MEDLFASVKNMRLKYREIFQSCFAECINKIDYLKSDDDVLEFIESYFKEVCEKRALLIENRNKFSCSCCGDCCKLACSEFSPFELKQKAQNGDNFASQFLSVFVPYNSKKEARKINPEYIKEVERLGEVMAKRGHQLVFGAGNNGVMGAAARGVKKANGKKRNTYE